MAIKSSTRARRFIASAISVAALSAGILSVGGAANAATSAPSDQPVKDCSYDLGTKQLVCVDQGQDLNRAVLEQAHLSVSDASAARSATAALPAGVQATYIQSRLYDDANYGGSYFQITNSASCNGATTFYFATLDSVGWAGRVSSFRSYSNCATKVWQGTNYSGAAYGYAVNASNLGAMNDQAHSVTMQ